MTQGLKLLKLKAISKASSARPKLDMASASRRPCCNLSSIGPMNGAMMANGATVMTRYSSTRPVDSAAAAAKNRVPASATASAASTA